jgi:hypothetical protein
MFDMAGRTTLSSTECFKVGAPKWVRFFVYIRRGEVVNLKNELLTWLYTHVVFSVACTKALDAIIFQLQLCRSRDGVLASG